MVDWGRGGGRGTTLDALISLFAQGNVRFAVDGCQR